MHSPHLLKETSLSALRPRADSAPEKRVRRCVEAARATFPEWSQRPLSARKKLLQNLLKVLAESAEEIAKTLSEETGRPLQESLGAEVLPSLEAIRFLLKNTDRLLASQRIPKTSASLEAMPYGVVGIIGTWNYPLFLNLVPLAQALVAGNTVVWKPSERTPLSSQALLSLFRQAGVEEGVLEILSGGGDVGSLLTQAQCDKYLFTGSVTTGREILVELAKAGIPSVMELSGNDAFIVCADAPLELAARSAVWGRVCNGGQSCVAPQRFYVHHTLYEPFLRRVEAEIATLRPEEITPLRTKEAKERCHHKVQEAVEQGAKCHIGGFLAETPEGFFYPPTLLSDCTDDLAVMQEDLFAPVLAVCPVQTDREAVERANSNSLGLGASIWTQNISYGEALAKKLRVGLVSINEVLRDAADPALPFGGVRQSGFGKQRGALGLEEFVVRKVVVSHSPQGARRHLFPYLNATEELLLAWIGFRYRQRWKSLSHLIIATRKWQEEQRLRKGLS